ncbi:DEAD/DEAH box helicase [Tranquillimonas alkanivorans]|uniref:ATP-dependent helicase YprA, contains C-terminal metal-binding DUF1998 domain n=1 Tax=Tranquillimonas alkanivorans TaxID=441119 RepID=A0A1I5VHV1_9RHOB|nr:DEAD/DEAH box helicase [Tranquillimonas alkanivorans]SFQ06952.1 ATP-dependent helicase YprA, contains C-terminal metal-binding DUF1998 domain [Tranquillimonas alkanivorans]
MKAFQFDQAVIDEYASFSRSFTSIRAEDLAARIDAHYEKKKFWPSPFLALNPAYKQAKTAQEFADDGALAPETADVFRVETRDGALAPIRFHSHQAEAITKALLGQSFVVTTGTGSGKSLCFFVPIVDRVLRARKAGEASRTRAIIVYPMNALANSQISEIEKFVGQSDLPEGMKPTVARYTGQEGDAERRKVAANPPDILLTNYMMLELLLTRQDETDARVIENCKGLEFIVLDELHTYRGRQGADVSVLVRRLRDRCRLPGEEPVCIGTSATMATEDVADRPTEVVAGVASRIFGAFITPDAVITESLRRATDDELSLDWAKAQLKATLQEPIPDQLTDADLKKHPLAVWAELSIGLDEARARSRRSPIPLDDAVDLLAADAEIDREIAAERLAQFLALAALPEKDRGGIGGSAFMAFKLHRFVSGAGDVLTTLKAAPRTVLLEGQREDPNDPGSRLYPTRFCRSCGQEYHVVTLREGPNGREAIPRDIDDAPASTAQDEEEPGYLTPFEEPGDDFRFSGDIETYPEEWREERRGVLVLRNNRRKQQPRRMKIRADGLVGEDGRDFWFLPGRFGFCLACHDQPAPQARERNKLGGLSAEGRSSATTTLVTAMLRLMNDADIGIADAEKRKTLGFGDNRQDSALQAGHFNDSVFVTLLRGAILRAVLDAGEEGLTDDGFGTKVQRALGYLPEKKALRKYWMAHPETKGATVVDASRTLAKVLEHRAWSDMRRGWRFTYPNLIGVGLLTVGFVAIDEFLEDEEVIASAPDVWRALEPEAREQIARAVLGTMLEGLAVATTALDPQELDPLKGRTRGFLCAPWAIDPKEDLRGQSALVLESPPRREQSKRDDALILRGGYRSGLARGINKESVLGRRLNEDEYLAFMHWLLDRLEEYGLVQGLRTLSDLDGWQIQPNVVRLLPGPAIEGVAEKHNSYFQKLYRDVSEDLLKGRSPFMGMESREHTAQVSSLQREWREWRFRFGEHDQELIEESRAEMIREGEGTSFLPALFCSPTMELGVDISSLNAVYLRNVPPTPANYAQRAGRAGRSGQAATITTYCAAQSPHDQYYFRRIHEMVAGSVRPPALDLANEDLVRAHLQAVWLSETRMPLSANIPEVLNLEGDTLPLRNEIRAAIEDADVVARAVPPMRRVVDALLDHFDGPKPDWLEDVDGWIDRTARGAATEFDRAFDRWRTLHGSAHRQLAETQAKLRRPGLSGKDRARLDAQAQSASQQIGILENGKARNGSDFYTYRYLATEGFLPGYNFPRLPLYAFVPAGGSDARAAFLQRARFLAISEFGPRSLIYHEGRAYRVHKAKLPPGSVSSDGRTLATEKVFMCPNCGAGHTVERERCHACDVPMAGGVAIHRTLRIDNVETLPAERITANDEERVRQGFEVRTVFAWPERDGALDVTECKLTLDGHALATIQYANSADIMRLNLGLKRRSDPQIVGFPIDPSTGRWARLQDEVAEEDRTDPDATYPERIVPIVHDRKNSLLIRFSDPERWSQDALATVQHALMRGIEIVFQLEEGEIMGEPLPERTERRTILLYEATEGGAGVLGRLMRETSLLRRVVDAALNLMHYSGVEDALASKDRAALSDKEAPCVAGCYRCLLSYFNQPDHEVIDRRDEAALDLLLSIAVAKAEVVTAHSSSDPWIAAFEAAGLPRPDGEELNIKDVVLPYVWPRSRVAATAGPIPGDAVDLADAKGWDVHALPASPAEGVPELLASLIREAV